MAQTSRRQIREMSCNTSFRMRGDDKCRRYMFELVSERTVATENKLHIKVRCRKKPFGEHSRDLLRATDSGSWLTTSMVPRLWPRATTIWAFLGIARAAGACFFLIGREVVCSSTRHSHAPAQ